MLSEVGSKDAEAIFAPYQWVEWIREELAAGAWKVITEARESGTAGIFRGSGEVRSGLIDEIVHELPVERLLFEAPQKGAAGVVHPAVRGRRQPRQHPAGRGDPARNAAPRAAVRHDERIAAQRLTQDLHCHSSASDGLLAPAALVEHAHALGLETLALTDHDTLAGVGEAAAAADRLGLRFVAATEISVRPPSGSMHLLAYLPVGRRRAARDAHPGDRRLPREPQPAHRASASTSSATRSRGRTSRGARRDGSAVRTSRRRSWTPATSRNLQDAFDRLLADGQPAYVDAGLARPGGGRRGRRRERRRARARAPVLAAHGRCRARALRREGSRRTGCAASRASGPTTTTRSARSRGGCARKPVSCRPADPTGTATRTAPGWATRARCRCPPTRSRGSVLHERTFLLR